jgi:hypothetical protein
MSNRLLRCMIRVVRCTRAVSAIEFALFAPLLCFGLLMMVDVGMTVGTRMELDRNVRAGAQAAMSLNNNSAGIAAIVASSAGSPEDLQVQVRQLCLCGDAAAACSLTCPSAEPPSVIFTIDAARPISGMLLGERTVSAGARVQVR